MDGLQEYRIFEIFVYLRENIHYKKGFKVSA